MVLIEHASSLGMVAPDFRLPATDGDTYELADFEHDALVIMFLCNHCPYVKAVNARLVSLAKDYADRVSFAAICSNDAVRYPDDSFERMREVAVAVGYPFPYLHDETQAVAEEYGAVCTPEFFLFDADRRLVYRGRLDDATRAGATPSQHDLRDAIDAVLRDEKPSEPQPSAMGCGIKWKY